jgi:hypothetical protein
MKAGKHVVKSVGSGVDFLLENIEKKYREEGRSSQISRQKLVIAAIFFARKTETII